MPSMLQATIDLCPDRDALKTLRRARDRFLEDPQLEAISGVRPEIMHSWRRSLINGVDRTNISLPAEDVEGRSQRLSLAAAPVMQRLDEQLRGSQAWGMLLDRNCTQLGSVVGDDGERSISMGRGSRPGAVFHEARVGTNGAGTAAERLESFVVVGPEHFREAEGSIVSVGAPVRDAMNRIAGIVSLNVRLEHSNSILVPFARDIAWAIGARLAEQAEGVERELFARFSLQNKRPSKAVVAAGGGALIANVAARQLTAHGVRLETIAQRALDAVQNADESEFTVTDADECVRVRATRIVLSNGSIATLATLQRGAAARSCAGPARSAQEMSEPDAGLIAAVRRAKSAGQPVMIVGERGSGKLTLAVRVAGEHSPVRDARGAARNHEQWLESLRVASRSADSVVLAHLDELPVELRAAVAEIMDASGAWFVATTVTAVSSDAPSGLDDRFAAVVHRSPLRERPTEFVGIVSNLLAQIGVGGASLRCDPHVLAVLSKQRWPGNISQLRRVLASAAISATNGEIALVDVPVTALLDAQARGLGRLERLEREEILASLAESAWNREAAAKALGISRATMYRKLKQFNISVPSSRD